MQDVIEHPRSSEVDGRCGLKPTTDESREFLKGGAIELSRVMEAETKNDPHRFASLARRFPAGVNSHYVDAILRGLGDASRQVLPEAVYDAIRHFYSLPEKPGGRWMTRPLARIADQGVPDDELRKSGDAAVNWLLGSSSERRVGKVCATCRHRMQAV